MEKETNDYNDKNDLFIRRIVFLFYVLTSFGLAITGMNIIGSLITTLQNSDILINTSEYTKRYVVIDSIDIYKEKGVNSGDIIGYSKELDNYKTQIKMGSFSDALFGSQRTIRDVLGEEYDYDSRGKYSRYVWYRKGAKYTYITDKEEIRYPVSDVLRRRFFNFFTFSFVILLVINRIIKYIFKTIWNFNLI